MFDLSDKKFSEDIVLSPYQHIELLNNYMNELYPIYTDFFLS